MTVPLQTRRSPVHLGNGVATSFAWAFKVFSSADIEVTVADVDGVETLLTLDVDYSVSVNADQDATPGGTVTYPLSGPLLQTGEKLVIVGATQAVQATDLQNYGFYPQSVEDMVDKLTMVVQQVLDTLTRAATLADTTSGASLSIPAPESDTYIGWNTAATALENKSIVVAGALTVSAFIEDLLDDVDAAAARATIGAISGTSPTITTPAVTGGTFTQPQLASVGETFATPASAAGVLTLDCAAASFFVITLTENVTSLVFSSVPSGVAFMITLRISQDGTGGRALTWPAAVKGFGTATGPVITTTALKTDVVSLLTVDGGTTWLAFVAGQDA